MSLEQDKQGTAQDNEITTIEECVGAIIQEDQLEKETLEKSLLEMQELAKKTEFPDTIFSILSHIKDIEGSDNWRNYAQKSMYNEFLRNLTYSRREQPVEKTKWLNGNFPEWIIEEAVHNTKVGDALEKSLLKMVNSEEDLNTILCILDKMNDMDRRRFILLVYPLIGMTKSEKMKDSMQFLAEETDYY